MSIEKDLKIGDRIRHKQTGQEMEVVELPEVYDVDERRSIRTNIVVFSTFETGKDCNTIGEINIADIELISQGDDM